jgi:hypothetical protein
MVYTVDASTANVPSAGVVPPPMYIKPSVYSFSQLELTSTSTTCPTQDLTTHRPPHRFSPSLLKTLARNLLRPRHLRHHQFDDLSSHSPRRLRRPPRPRPLPPHRRLDPFRHTVLQLRSAADSLRHPVVATADHHYLLMDPTASMRHLAASLPPLVPQHARRCEVETLYRRRHRWTVLSVLTLF